MPERGDKDKDEGGGGGRASSEESVIGMEAQVPEEKLQFIMFQ